ncbi:MAG: hypothetical protein ACQEXJ_05080 [Myxococcota bacterium]
MRTALLALALLLLAAPARGQGAADLLDEAAACHRRDRPECTLRKADAALEALTDESPAALRREALLLRAEALALLDRPEEAREAFRALLSAQPSWRPPPDADPRVRSAAEDARRERLLEHLPDTLDAGPPPEPEAPKPEEMLPDPALYAPDHIVEMDPEESLVPKWRLSLGAGVGLLAGDSADRFDAGPTALLEVSRDLVGPLSLWFQAALSLLSFDDSVQAEPGYSRGLTTASAVLGLQVGLPVGGDFDIVLAGGVGAGGFGLRNLDEAVGAAFHGSAGVRWQMDEHLALRVDAVPTLFVPAGDVGAAGHVSVVGRAEIRF